MDLIYWDCSVNVASTKKQFAQSAKPKMDTFSQVLNECSEFSIVLNWTLLTETLSDH